MEYLTTKILYPHHNRKHVASLHSKRWLKCLLHFIELNEVKREHRKLIENRKDKKIKKKDRKIKIRDRKKNWSIFGKLQSRIGNYEVELDGHLRLP